MDPAWVEKILCEVREDHWLVTEQLRILAELEGSLSSSDQKHRDRAIDLVRECSRFFQTKLLPHMDSEENGMFILFRDHLPKGSTLIYELEAEHEQIRKLCEQLQAELALLRHEKYRNRPGLLLSLEKLCSEITHLLSQHAEREEQLVQQYVKSTLVPC